MEGYARSGKAVIGLPIFLNRLKISAKLAAVQKYCCFNLSSLPTGAKDQDNGLNGKHVHELHVLISDRRAT